MPTLPLSGKMSADAHGLGGKKLCLMWDFSEKKTVLVQVEDIALTSHSGEKIFSVGFVELGDVFTTKHSSLPTL